MGRRKIKMEIVKDAASRLVTFSKRRNGLFKKANELAILCGAELAIVVFSPGGKPFSFGHPSVDEVTQRFLRHLQDEDGEAKSPAGGTPSSSGSKKARRKAEKLNKRLMNLTKELDEERKKGAILDQAIEEKKQEYGLGARPATGPGDLRKLEGLRRSLEKVREEVKLRKREMEAASSLLVLAEELQLKEEDNNNVAESDDVVAIASDGGEIRNGN